MSLQDVDHVITMTAPPPPPGPVTITFISDSSLTVSWSLPSGPVESCVGGYVFGVTGEECGCVDRNVSADTTSVTCSGWSASGQTCSFEVRTLSLDCGFTSDSVTENVSLTVPTAPIDLSVTAVYTVHGSTQYIDVEFTGVDAPSLGAGLDSTISYTVAFTGDVTLQFTGVMCNSTNHCTLRVGGSQLSPNDRYTVSVVASNVVGSGPAVTSPNQLGVCRIECDLEVLGDSPASQSGPGSVPVPNGVVNYGGVTPGSVATLVCDRGYSPGSHSNRTYMSDGHWSRGSLTCVQDASADGQNSLSFGGSVALSVVLTFLVTLVLGVSIGVVSVSVYIKCRRRTDQSSSRPPTELRGPHCL